MKSCHKNTFSNIIDEGETGKISLMKHRMKKQNLIWNFLLLLKQLLILNGGSNIQVGP